MKALLTLATVAGAGVLYAWSLRQSKEIRQLYRDW
jgi:hypothetical protein